MFHDHKEIARRTLASINRATKEKITKVDIADPINFEFNSETGEIVDLRFASQSQYPNPMQITNFALYFPSEGLENENKSIDPELKYFKK